jgi:hypothetical protein
MATAGTWPKQLNDQRSGKIVRRTAIGGRGVFVAILQEELARRSLEVPFEAHDLITELEGGRVGSAFEKLVSTGHNGGA